MSATTNRREFLALLSALPLTAVVSTAMQAQQTMPTRRVPTSGEGLPVIGFGSSKVVQEIAENGEEPLRQVLRTLVARGGKVIDTWPRNPAVDRRFGQVINEPEFRDRLFITGKIDQRGKDAGIAQFRQTQEVYGRKTIDLMQIFSMTDVETHWPSLKDWKASGEARYIGVTVSDTRLHDQLEAFLRRERPDFTQVNYSITERQAEERILPLTADLGIAAVTNRPFMNGSYFQRLETQPLPPWAAEFGCTTWAQFNLKYILANPHVTCVLTETSNPRHMEENALAGIGAVPDEAALTRMRQLIDAV